QVEFAPFRAGIEAGARIVMVGHYGLPAITGDRATPATASREVMTGLIRESLGFDGLIVTDALDMGAFGGLSTDSPLKAGADLLLFGPAQTGATVVSNGRANDRLGRLLDWLASFPQPDLAIVGCDEHRELADELARRSITMVRNDAGLVPLKDPRRVLVVMPQPIDLTPADTSSFVEPGLARAIRRYQPDAVETVVSAYPTHDEIDAVVEQAGDHDLVIVGTIDANENQTFLMRQLIAFGPPVIGVSLRTPYDLAFFPELATYLSTYGIQAPSLAALADALFGMAPFPGRLPVAIPGMYPIGHGGDST
ncbi:MAG TPA: glycoside hydrolase family 3 N-terminal domain-containing protein, partial [Acidimicrobiia bacterium]|nr:glycoside hydrolase family 3 N-terminal domain-containing protein [Acidimicrobiia bacterium]